MAGTPAYPSVPADKLANWELIEESVETVFQLPGAKVVGAIRQYEDEQTRAAVREATDGDIDHKWRFFAGTRLGFDPMLPPGTMPSMILPTIRSEAKKNFKQRLEDRGLTDIEKRRTERVRVRSGRRARLTQYDAVDPVVDGGLQVTCWVGAWNDGTDFFVVTGGYPGVVLNEKLGLEGEDPALARTPNESQTELLDLFRDIS